MIVLNVKEHQMCDRSTTRDFYVKLGIIVQFDAENAIPYKWYCTDRKWHEIITFLLENRSFGSTRQYPWTKYSGF